MKKLIKIDEQILQKLYEYNFSKNDLSDENQLLNELKNTLKEIDDKILKLNDKIEIEKDNDELDSYKYKVKTLEVSKMLINDFFGYYKNMINFCKNNKLIPDKEISRIYTSHSKNSFDISMNKKEICLDVEFINIYGLDSIRITLNLSSNKIKEESGISIIHDSNPDFSSFGTEKELQNEINRLDAISKNKNGYFDSVGNELKIGDLVDGKFFYEAGKRRQINLKKAKITRFRSGKYDSDCYVTHEEFNNGLDELDTSFNLIKKSK